MTETELQNIASGLQLIGQIVFASMIVDPVVAGTSSGKGLAFGMVITITLFIGSFLIVRSGKQNNSDI